jgi:hypothetical protein
VYSRTALAFTSTKYIAAHVKKHFPQLSAKPNTEMLHDEYGEFEDQCMQLLVDDVCNAMSDEGLHDVTQNQWQRKLVQYIDNSFGGTSRILSIEQPWYEV